jgi:hypothetical protein
MNWKIWVVIAGLFSVLLAVLFASNKHLKESAEFARNETERVIAELERVKQQNAEIREILGRSYEAIQAANAALERARNEKAERTEKILDSDRIWLDESLPDGVRDAFNICTDGLFNATTEPIRTLCSTRAGSNGDKQGSRDLCE